MTLTDQEHIQSLRAGLSDEALASLHPTAHAEALALRRARLKLSLEDAAAALSLTPDELERIERGLLTPTDAQLVRISERYRLGLDRLRKNFAPAQEPADAPATQDTPSTPAR